MSKEAMKMALEDCKSHYHAWRCALEFALEKATNEWDISYWMHEINAFDRTFKELAEQPPAQQEPSLAAAWRQGYDQGVADERTSEANIGVAGFGAKVTPARSNPYSAKQPAQQEPSDRFKDFPTNDWGEPIIYDTNEIDEITGFLTGDEGEEDSVTVLHNLVRYLNVVHPGKTMTQVLIETEEAALAAQQQEPVANELKLHIIRKWPEGFQDRLQHVWLDVVSFIPDVKLYDLQRVLAEFGFTMKVYEGDPPASKPLTDEEIWDEVKAADLDWQTGWSLDEDAANRYIIFARAIEAKHGIKENT